MGGIAPGHGRTQATEDKARRHVIMAVATSVACDKSGGGEGWAYFGKLHISFLNWVI
jgi:hypothetical protein